MEKSKLIGMLKSFSKEDVIHFKRYLHFSLNNVNQNIPKFYELLMKHYPEFSSDSLNKKELFKELFPKQKFNDKKIRYLLTDLSAEVENYFVHHSLQQDVQLKKNLLLRELALRDCGKAYKTSFDAEEEIAETKFRDAGFYFHQYLAHHDHLNHYMPRQKRKTGSNIEKVNDYLDKFYLAKKLQLCCEIFNVQNILSVEYKVFLLDEILDHLKKNSFSEVPVISIYFRILMMLMENKNEKHFIRLRELLTEHEEKFAHEELRDMYQHVLNFCIRQVNAGNTSYLATLLDIYKIMLGNGVILTDGFLSQWDFKNIITIALRQKDFEWTFDFIHQHKKTLRPGDRENAFTFNLANYYFHKKDFSKTLGLLQQVEFTDVFYQLDSRSMLLKTYFEKEDEETFFYHIAAFKIFLKRNKLISDPQRSLYKNLIKFSSRLIRYEGNAKKLSALKTEIESTRNVADYQWLLAKAGEIK